MSWNMPAEHSPHERTWMAFPREGLTLGSTGTDRAEGYAGWAATAHAIAKFEPVTMLVDSTELARARRMLSSEITLVEAPVDEFWMRDHGPTFVIDTERPEALGAVDWIFNGWGAHNWAEWTNSAQHCTLIAELTGAERIPSLLVNEGGGIHVDGQGTILLTETVQLDPRRNPAADKLWINAEMLRTLGATHPIWVPRGLTRDYDDFGTNGHIDIVATFAESGALILHQQLNPEHPDFIVSNELREFFSTQHDANGHPFEILNLPAPSQTHDEHGLLDWSYVNHLVVNGGVIACGFGDETSDTRAREILAAAYPCREVVTVDARPMFARGGGIHCITQQQPRLPAKNTHEHLKGISV